jgi:hypothetical protein
MQRMTPQEFSDALARAAMLTDSTDVKCPESGELIRAGRIDEINRLIAKGVSFGYLRDPWHTKGEYVPFAPRVEAKDSMLTKKRQADVTAARLAISGYLLKV